MSELLPPPPEGQLSSLRQGDVRVVPIGHRLVRLIFDGGPHPIRWNEFRTFGPTRSRFDHHEPPPREHGPRGAAVSYWAMDGSRTPSPSNPIAAVLAEVFGETRVVDRGRHSPRLVVIELVRDVQLLDVSDSPWVVRNGGNASISSGRRAVARQWARAIHSTYPDLDGIWYQTSSCPPARSVVLNERARDALAANPLASWSLDDPGLSEHIAAAADAIGFGVI